MSPATTTIVVDDQEDIRFLIRHLIELSDGNLEVVAEAEDGESCLKVLEDLPLHDPQVIVIDWHRDRAANPRDQAQRAHHPVLGVR